MKSLALLFLLAQAQVNPLSTGAKHTYELVRGYLIEAAEKMPEQFYSYRPVPEERSFAQIVGHVADANFALCGVVAGERPPAGGFEKIGRAHV